MPAVRAYVFTCDGGKHQWVQYLEKYNDDGKKLLESKAAHADGVLPLVKRPGKGDWVGEQTSKGVEVMTPACPDGMGSGVVVPVLP